MNRRDPSRRVLFLFTEVFANGGIQRFNQTMLNACLRLGFDCHVLSLHDTSASIAKSACGRQLSAEGFGADRRAFAAAVAARMLRGGFDRVVIGHVNFLTLAMAVHVARPLNRPRMLLIAHGIEVWSGIDSARRAALKRIYKILCVSRYTRQRILDQAPALEPARLVLFPNSLADSWGELGEGIPKTDLPERYILSVTRLERGDRYKGISTVIEALSMLEDVSVHYLVIGHGDDLPFLELVAARSQVDDRVHFLRGISDAQMIDVYRHCEAFVLPSGKEGFGIVFLEAMFFGAPVIAASEKGALDVVRDEETGLTVPFGDTTALKEAIERLCTDRPLRDRLCANGRAQVVAGGAFTFARFTERCAQVFEFARTAAA